MRDVIITHMHPDHVGGLMAGEQRAFPNATVHADQHDADFWLSQAQMEKAPADAKGFFQGAMASLNPYSSAGKFKPFNGNTELVPGIRAQASPGHTPGHVVFWSAEAQRCWVGDVLFAGSIGRTDFPGGNHADLLAAIRDKLWPMGDDTVFIPGHGPESTFGRERRMNPHVKDRD